MLRQFLRGDDRGRGLLDPAEARVKQVAVDPVSATHLLSCPELSLVGLNELRTLDRWTLERRSRALAFPVFLGTGLMLTRVLGRYKLYVPAADIGFGVHVIMDGLWEPWVTIFTISRIKPGMRVVDAGANHGYYTVLLADLVGPQGRVAAFEPHPQTSRLLRRTLYVNGLDDRTDVHETALVAEDGVTLQFWAIPEEPKNARIVPDDWADQPDVVTVAGATLNTALAQWGRIDFIKIDVEGAEEALLNGSWGTIERDRPELLLEFNASRCVDPARVLDRLAGIYGEALNHVDYDGGLVPVARAAVLDQGRGGEWMLFFDPSA